MKIRVDYYPYYEKLMGMRLEELLAEASEYNVLEERYPHLAESIKLKMEIYRLKEERKLLQKRTARLEIERKIVKTKTKLKMENILKRLYNEDKIEIIFKLRFTIWNFKKYISSSVGEVHTGLMKVYIDFHKSLNKAITNFQKDLNKSRKNLHKVLRKTLPPTIFNIKSMNVVEKSLSVKEWVQERYKKH